MADKFYNQFGKGEPVHNLRRVKLDQAHSLITGKGLAYRNCVKRFCIRCYWRWVYEQIEPYT